MSNFNDKQKEILTKQFKIEGASDHSLTRGDFEGFPCPMLAWNWTDEQMEKLAHNISLSFGYDEYPEEDDVIEEIDMEFYKIIEAEALKMGMQYYEDLDDEELDKLEADWNSIK